MAVVRVQHTIGDLAADLAQIPPEFVRRGAKVVRSAAREGNKLAKANAKRTAGAHGKHYPKRFTAEALSALEWEYGPSGRPQGEMSFEYGSRNQPPHLDLNKSADVIGPKFADDVGDMLDGLFWV